MMKTNAITRWLTIGSIALLPVIVSAADQPKTEKPKAAAKPQAPPQPKPTLADVPYGSHPKQVMDFYKANSTTPTPLVFYIHGGGWTHGDKSPFGSVSQFLKAGISVVSIQYRFTSDAQAAGAKPPVEWPLRDAARALQFVRSKAAEWNIDKVRIGATGGSAGACSSLWLAFHPDMADANSSDPIAKESTRLFCAAVNAPQTTLDPKQMKEWTPNSKYGGHAFGCKSFQDFLDSREKIMPWIKQYSPYEFVTSDDPPIYMVFGTPPALGQEQKDPTHTANFGVKLQEKCRSVGVECEVMYPGAEGAKHKNTTECLIDKLKDGKK